MSEATIIRFPRPRAKAGSRSGRFSTAELYEAASTAAQREAARKPERGTIRLTPPLQKDRPGMATDYSFRLAPRCIARVKLEERGADQSWIDWVFVPPGYRDQRLGRRLMDHVTADADAHGVTLSLEARACAGLEQEKLEAFYRGFGFVKTGKKGPFGPIMTRAPRATARRAA